MRIDVSEAIERNLQGKIQVRLNGLIQPECIMADEENGIIKVYDIEETKRLNMIVTRILKGDVEIIFLN